MKREQRRRPEGREQPPPQEPNEEADPPSRGWLPAGNGHIVRVSLRQKEFIVLHWKVRPASMLVVAALVALSAVAGFMGGIEQLLGAYW